MIARSELGEGEMGGYPSPRGKLQRALETACVEFADGEAWRETENQSQ
jgi:hypothetical protein